MKKTKSTDVEQQVIKMMDDFGFDEAYRTPLLIDMCQIFPEEKCCSWQAQAAIFILELLKIVMCAEKRGFFDAYFRDESGEKKK
jgi:hypothetical protein